MIDLTPDALRAGPVRPGCPLSQVKDRLWQARLRPTLQRVSLGWLLFGKGDRHISAEMLFEEAAHARVPVSLGTIYNTLRQFTEAGLLRQIAVDARKTYFDTNVTEHHHFLIEGEEELMDIPSLPLGMTGLPVAPDGYEITRVDVFVWLKRKPRFR
jgi:Fur family iron response transcriptional regulator